MEVFIAKYDYEKEREDVLSFKKGDKFQIASKADRKWWAAYAIQSEEYGYVPSRYLEPYIDELEGELAQQLSESKFGDSKKAALAELKKKIPRAPVSSSNISKKKEEEEEEEEKEEEEEGEKGDSKKDGRKGDVVIIKPLSEISKPPEDCQQIEPKPLSNPHKESKQHVMLNKEIKLNSARGGAQNLGRPELEKVYQRRKPDAEGKLGPIRADRLNKSKSSCDTELEKQLSRRTQLLDQAEKDVQEDTKKPEFMKISLRKAQPQC